MEYVGMVNMAKAMEMGTTGLQETFTEYAGMVNMAKAMEMGATGLQETFFSVCIIILYLGVVWFFGDDNSLKCN